MSRGPKRPFEARAKRLVDGDPEHPRRSVLDIYREVEGALQAAYDAGVEAGRSEVMQRARGEIMHALEGAAKTLEHRARAARQEFEAGQK